MGASLKCKVVLCAELSFLAALVLVCMVARAAADEWTERPVAELVALAMHDDPGTRNHAIVALGKIGGPEAERALLLALNDVEWENRWRAAEGLGRIGEVSSVLPLVQRLVAEVATEDALKKGDEPLLLHGYVTWPEFLQRQMAIAAREILKRHQTPEGLQCREILVGTMQNAQEPARVRIQVALLLAELGERRTVPLLIESLTAEPSGALRAFAAEALGALGAQEAVPALQQALTDPYLTPDKRIPIVRNAAARALEKLQP